MWNDALAGDHERIGHLAKHQPSAKAGVGMNDGRCIARPSARANSRLVTGSGAVVFTGPLIEGVSMIQRIISIQSIR